MEYKGATIGVLVVFSLLFVGALFVVMGPGNDATDDGGDGNNGKTAKQARKNLTKLMASVPDGRPDERDADADPTFIETPSGLRYRFLRKSDGKKPTGENGVAVHYRGWLDSGQEFDSSYNANKPFLLNPPWRVIEGWKEGIKLAGEGAMIELEIPSNLAYGPQGRGEIPPNAKLHFTVEVLKVFDE